MTMIMMDFDSSVNDVDDSIDWKYSHQMQRLEECHSTGHCSLLYYYVLRIAAVVVVLEVQE